MTFRTLYEEVQLQQGKISTNWIRQRAVGLSRITDIKEIWSNVVDPKYLRGFYIEGPLGPPIPRAANESLIVLSHSMCTGTSGKYWRRFIKTKEMMHVFDNEEELTDTPEKFDDLLEKFRNPTAPTSPQYHAEFKAQWRALAVLCQESRRMQFKGQLERNEVTLTTVSSALQIPEIAVKAMMREDFLDLVQSVMD